MSDQILLRSDWRKDAGWRGLEVSVQVFCFVFKVQSYTIGTTMHKELKHLIANVLGTNSIYPTTSEDLEASGREGLCDLRRA